MNISTKYILLTLVAISSAVFYTCKNPFDGIEILANGDVYGNAPTGIVFINANANSPTPVGDFTVKISGTNADKVINDVGKKEFKVVGGMLSLALQEGVKPTISNPIQFHISAEPEGYTPISQAIVLTHDSVSLHMIKMVQYTNLPEGTSAVVGNSTTLTANVTTQEKTFSLPSTATKSESATIALQTGTQFLSETGVPLVGGELKTNIVQYSTANNSAVAAIPGGLFPQNVVDQNGNKMQVGAFTPAAVVSIDMKVGNQDVKKFSKPLKVDIDVSPQIINPNTGVAIKAGDQIPVWSLNEETGQYKKESTTTVVNKNGKLAASFDVNHLSMWGLLFYTDPCSYPKFPSLTVMNLDWFKTISTTQVALNRSGQIIESKTVSLSYGLLGHILSSSAFNTSQDIKLVYYTPDGGKVYESDYFNPCTSVPSITLDGSKFTDVTIEINVEGKCPGKKTTVLPNALIKIRDISSSILASYINNTKVTYLTNGKATIALKDNTKYIMEVVYDGKTKSTEFTFNKTDMALPANNPLTGTINYSPTTATAQLNAQFIIPNCK